MGALSQVVSDGRVFINASFSNTLISVTDLEGNVISWSSAGAAGCKGARKRTAHAAQLAAEIAIKKAVEKRGVKRVAIEISGPGQGREAAARAIARHVEVGSLTDCTPNPHNGCKRRKQRRV